MSLALRLLWRDWRGGELGMLLAALALAVGIVTTLGMFVDRLQSAVERRGSAFLAGDLVLRSREAVPQEWLLEARKAGLRDASVLDFATMAIAGDAMQLASVKAVSAAYPLLGKLGISERPGDAALVRSQGPPRGEVWADTRLLQSLGIRVGDLAEIGLASLRVSAVLVSEPDAGASFVAFGPRLMMNLEDIPATGVIQPGSRVQYSYLFAGEKAAVARWRASVEPRLLPSQRLLTMADGQPRVARSLARAESFLLLAGSLGVVMAGVALAMAARRYTRRHTGYVAILKTLGLGAGDIRRLYFVNLLLLAAAGTVLGWAMGWLLQEAVFAVIASMLDMEVPAPGWRPLLLGAGTGLVCLAGLAAPPVVAMSAASPLRVLREDVQEGVAGRSIYAAGFASLGVLLWWYSGDPGIGLIVLCCLLGAAAVVWACTHAILRRARVPGARANSALRLAFGALQRHAALNALQVLVFGLCIMLGLLMVLLRGALMDDWQRQLPPRTPNHFLLNIAPYQVQPLERFLGERKLEAAGLFPMVPGRVLEVNGSPARVQPGHELNLDRDWNLAWSDTLPEGNTLLEGQWWPADAAGEVSAEAGVARALGLKLGDRLALQIGADRIEARLTSIRDLDWDSMRPNFFLLFPRRSLEAQAAMWLTSFYLPPGSGPVVNELLREFPTVSVIEMDAILAQVRGVTRQLALAVELVLGLLLAAGALVMVASVQAGLELRFRESAILRTLGAGRGLVLGSLVMEFALLGGFAGVLATAGAESAAWLVQVRLMDLQPSFHPEVWVAGPLLGAVVCALLGMITCRRVVDTPPAVVLRNGG